MVALGIVVMNGRRGQIYLSGGVLCLVISLIASQSHMGGVVIKVWFISK